MVGAVLVAGHHEAGDTVERNRATVVVGLGEQRVEALEHPLGDAEICPSQIGVARIRISAPRTFSTIWGHWSPLPSSMVTPGLTSKSATRTNSVSTPSDSSAPVTTRASASVFDTAGDAFSVQFRTMAFMRDAYPDGVSTHAEHDPRRAESPDEELLEAESLDVISELDDVLRVRRIAEELATGFDACPLGKACLDLRLGPHASTTRSTRPPREAARRLGEEGFAIITGGGPGIMAAANRGARDAGVSSIGLDIELPHEQAMNELSTSR